MDFVRTNFGGPLEGQNDPYNINLSVDTSTNCPYHAEPCYSGLFTNPTSGAQVGARFYATVTFSGDQVLFTATASDYPDRGPQIYTATAPNDRRLPLEFRNGSFVQYNYTENRDWKATFAFYQL